MIPMKRIAWLILMGVMTISCSTQKKAASGIAEDELIITRKYVGVFLDYRHTGPENYDGPNIIWIKTSFENLYGKISAYGRKCEFSQGERIYLRRTFYSPGIVSGYWVYTIENDSGVSYRATDLQHDREVFLKTWFEY
jgi:hypothetical protein